MSLARALPFGPYLLHERLSVGGMAEVWKATDRATGAPLAIKRLLPSLADDEDFVGMFHDEATIASKLQHPNVVRIHNLGAEGRHLYIAMELVEGKDCRTILNRAEASGVRVPIRIVLGIVAQAARGLGYAHARVDGDGKSLGVVHRDVSLQNLIVSNEGVVKIIDFGIAKAEGNIARTAVGTIKGKFGYMAPEQVVGDPVDARTDVFALGIVAWELLTGQRLFLAANDVATIEKVRRCEISLPSEHASVPEKIDEIVMKALAKRPEDRYLSASNFLVDLEEYARGGGDVADAAALAAYLRATFGAGPPAESSATRSREETMSEEKKGGSDLDVFEGLQKKPGQAPSLPPAAAPPAPPQRQRAKTMLGVAPPPVAPPGAIPVARGTMPMPMPMPPPSRVPGAGPPLPPPSSRSAAPPPPPPPGPGGMPSIRSTLTMPMPPVPSRPPVGGLPAPLPPPGGPRSAPPPVVPPPNKTGPGPVTASQRAPGDMDWDDDEKTNIYDKQDTQEALASVSKPLPAAGAPSRRLGGAAALAGASGGIAAPPPAPAPASLPRPGSLPPPAPLPMPAAPVAATAPLPARSSGRADPTQVVKSQEGGSGKGLILGVVAFLVLAGAAAAFFILSPKNGSLIVQVKSGGRDVSAVEVQVDGKKVCDGAPCKVKDLPKGSHTVKAIATGYEPGSEIVIIRAGEESAIKVELARGKDAAPDQPSGAASGTGLKVAGPAFVKLSIDGKEVGPLPQEVKDLSPGEHTVKLAATDRYKTDERKLTFAENEIKDLGTVKLTVLKGKAKLNLNTPGAFVKLQSGAETRVVAKFPIELEIDPAKTWTIIATKPGFVDYRQDIKFDDEAEKTFDIVLYKKGEKKDEPATKTDDKKDDKKKDEPRAESGNGTLSINSIPPSNCILDGRPLGMTPKAGISVSAGTHTVVFVHPEHGRKSASVTVKAGESKSVGVRF